MCVKAGGRLIKQQQTTGHQQRACDGDALSLPDRQPAGLIANRRINTLRQKRDELANPGFIQRKLQLRFGGFRAGEQDVFAQRRRGQLRILPDPAQETTPAVGIQTL